MSSSQKRLVVSAMIGPEFEELGRFSWLRQREYAEKIGADVILLANEEFKGWPLFYEKFQIRRLLEEYERVLWLDLDVLVLPSAPDVFELVPPEIFGAVNERYWRRPVEYAEEIECRLFQLGLPKKPWDGFYFNSGVMVTGRAHAPLWKRPQNPVWGHPAEQGHLNALRLHHGIPFRDLGDDFNRFVRPGEHISTQAHLLHYARWIGAPGSGRILAQRMAADYARLTKGEGP